MNPIIAPSVLSADFANLQSEIEMLNQSKADWIHLDIMDGRFVPNISFGIPVTKAINRIAKKPLDIHLMILEPEKYLEAFKVTGVNILSVHLEACKHLHRVIYQIKELGCKAGIAINPHTPVNLLNEVIADIDLVCLMSVNPGFGGQKFIQHTYNKTVKLKELINSTNSKALIEIDGGVNLENAPKLLSLGADVLVAGSFVFSSPEPLKTIADLKAIRVSSQ